MSKKEEKKAPAPVGGEEAPKSKKKTMIIIIVAVLVLLAGGGGAAWFFLIKGKASKEEKKPEPPAVAIFVPLDRFTVNLQQEQGDQVLQVGLSLKIYDPELEEKIKKNTPEIRSRLLMLLSSKRASELSRVDGKKQLSNEIVYLVNTTLGIKKPLLVPVVHPAVMAPPPPAAAPVAAVPAGGGLAAALQQAQPAPPVAVAPQTPVSVTDLVPEQSNGKEDREGVVDVLFTDFIIQ
ncbi:MAG: flagellar basal body-associated protein FliL [Ferrovum sp.]|nr:flagellar basal body-associated protein FliL [Ferrovum sp.]NDU88079.1 flagellar basal body-associated protein FliL [Ferrovum sp.]